jgi:hypothetical protein
MKKLITLFLALSMSSLTFGQHLNCETIRDSLIASFKNPNSDKLEMAKDVLILQECAELDEQDKTFLTVETVAVLIVGKLNQKEPLTYGLIIDEILKIKSSEQYQEMKETTRALFELENELVDMSEKHWPLIKEVFEKSGLSAKNIDEFKSAIYKARETPVTYKTAIQEWQEVKEKQASERAASTGEKSFIRHFAPMIPMKETLEIASEFNEPILLYFTGYAAVNCRKMEELVFQEEAVDEALSDYTCFIGYADDRTRLTEEEKDKYGLKEIETKGKMVCQIQKDHFQSNIQPYFVIIDNKGQMVDSFSYSLKPEAFLEFLIKNK